LKESLVPKIQLKSASGSFERSEGDNASCKFVYRPNKEGESLVEVYRISKKQSVKVGSVYFSARKLPIPVAYIGTKNGGEISKKFLMTMGASERCLMECPLMQILKLLNTL
jgi:hypothetical protein